MATAKGNTKAGWKKLRQDIEKQQIGRLYLFYGEERYLLGYYKEELIRAVVGDNMPEFNLIELSGKISVDSLAEAVDAYPVMSERKLVIVSDFDVFRADESTKKRLTELFLDLPEHCCLLFLFPAEFKPDKRTKLFGAISKAGEVIEFARAERHDLIAWIKRRFRAQNRTIDTSLCEYLIFYCGGLMQALIPEIDKIAAYTRRNEVRREDIDAVATPNVEAVVFDLTDALSARQYQKSLSILEKLMTLGEEPIALLALIGRQMRQLYAACLLRQRGKGTAELMRMWGMHSEYPAKIIFDAARGITLGWARTAVLLCAEIDAKLKLGAKEEMLEYLIARLAAYHEGTI